MRIVILVFLLVGCSSASSTSFQPEDVDVTGVYQGSYSSTDESGRSKLYLEQWANYKLTGYLEMPEGQFGFDLSGTRFWNTSTRTDSLNVTVNGFDFTYMRPCRFGTARLVVLKSGNQIKGNLRQDTQGTGICSGGGTRSFSLNFSKMSDTIG